MLLHVLRVLTLAVVAVWVYATLLLRLLLHLAVEKPGVVEIVVALRLAPVVRPALRVR